MFFGDREARADTYRHPLFLACVRQHVLPPEGAPCQTWDSALRRLGYPVAPGFNELSRPDFVIYRFPERATWAPAINRLVAH
jgi:hypothetical protein